MQRYWKLTIRGYLRLCEDQLELRRNGWISSMTYRMWSEGMRQPPYHGMKRLRIRWERRADIHEAFLSLAAALICWSFVQRWRCYGVFSERPFRHATRRTSRAI